MHYQFKGRLELKMSIYIVQETLYQMFLMACWLPAISNSILNVLLLNVLDHAITIIITIDEITAIRRHIDWHQGHNERK